MRVFMSKEQGRNDENQTGSLFGGRYRIAGRDDASLGIRLIPLENVLERVSNPYDMMQN